MATSIWVNLGVLLGTVVSVLVFLALGILIGWNILGIRRYYRRAEEPTLKRMAEAKKSYKWLGTSAFYVIGDGKVQDLIIDKKKGVKFQFLTLDPDCDSLIEKHASWQEVEKQDLKERIEKTRGEIQFLQRHDIDIEWWKLGQLPTFRVVIIDDETVLVSFYEKRRRGPESMQLELSADGLLGRWFRWYYEKTQAMATAGELPVLTAATTRF